MKLKLSEVKFNRDLYPRDELDYHLVEKYKLSLDDLPPIVVSKDYTLIDGYHRLRANLEEGRSEIEVDLLDVDSETDIFLEAIQRNAKHGKQLSRGEKKRLARTIYTDWYGKFTQKELADLLAVSVGTISNWCIDLDDQKRGERKQEVIGMYLDYLNYPKQEDVAHALGVAQSTVSGYIKDFKSESFDIDSLHICNVWRFPSPNLSYGITYPRRIPGQILENLLYYYTKVFDLVADPMSGGGTTLDVCKAMYRRYACFDINPPKRRGIMEKENDIEDFDINPIERRRITEKDIINFGIGPIERRGGIVKNDILNGIPLSDSCAKLVFLDPPYWNFMDEYWDFGDEDYTEGLSNLNYHDWLEAMSKIGDECYRVLSNEGICALLVRGLEDERGDKRFKDAPIDSANLFRAKGFEIIQRISVPINEEDMSFGDRISAERDKKMLSINRDLILFKKA